MNRLLRYFLLFVTLIVAVGIVSAQENESFRGFHKVKRKETIFGISHMYEISIEDLIQANPEMKEPGYELKKGTILKIPFPKGKGQGQNKMWYSKIFLEIPCIYMPSPCLLLDARKNYKSSTELQIKRSQTI